MDVRETAYHSLSEVDSFSDSDWLDIPSSRASEDSDSLLVFDSDREDSYDRPSSRRSFSSVPSSRDEVAAGWEGLIEDSSDEAEEDATTPREIDDPKASEADHIRRFLRFSPNDRFNFLIFDVFLSHNRVAGGERATRPGP